jgi:hypothetical protein
MKSLIITIILAFTVSIAAAQNFGFSFSISSKKVLGLDLFYAKNSNRFHFGYGYQFNGQKNTVVKERKGNYGLTKIENGDFFWLIDLGYSRIIFKKLTIHPELSFGTKHFFTSYKDDRFKDNGYSLINRSEEKTGIGLNLGYFISEKTEPFIGYHTLKKLNFGIRFSF